MRFGPLPLAQAAGAILAHSHDTPAGALRKGHVLAPPDIAALAQAGVAEVTVAALDPGDIAEDAAAVRLAQALVPDPAAAGLELTPPVNGRVNLRATRFGILGIDAGRVLALNRIDPALTLATLPALARVWPGALVGTAKIITYAVPEAALVQAEAAGRGAVRVHPVIHRDAALVMTFVPGQAESLAAKGRRSTAGRLRGLGLGLAETREVPHEVGALAEALGQVAGDIVLILTGSATSDMGDVAPEAVRRAGGAVARFGIPVDPGNLLFHGSLGGSLGGRPVIGLPGCARSPALNGADWVLERIACGRTPTAEDIAAMGVGGLLKESPMRGQPREG
jgi:molybdenum cofactor cytidylyltransferase